jgi:hypothetical protein
MFQITVESVLILFGSKCFDGFLENRLVAGKEMQKYKIGKF